MFHTQVIIVSMVQTSSSQSTISWSWSTRTDDRARRSSFVTAVDDISLQESQQMLGFQQSLFIDAWFLAEFVYFIQCLQRQSAYETKGKSSLAVSTQAFLSTFVSYTFFDCCKSILYALSEQTMGCDCHIFINNVAFPVHIDCKIKHRNRINT